MKQTIAIAGFWLAPDFTPEMQSGKIEPPRINHDLVDWDALAKGFEQAFGHEAHGVSVRFPDDTVDQTVLHYREAGQWPGPMSCEDFAEALLAKAQQTEAPVIPIRAEWSEWQMLKDRSYAPPPALIPLVLEGEAEDIAIVFRNMQGLLGVQAALDIVRTVSTPAEQLPEDYFQGYLFPEIKQTLEGVFGAPYQKYCLLNYLTPSMA